jgi:YjbE family integral membrane protein
LIVIDLITSGSAVTLIQVVIIDLVLAADNAIVVALAAAGLPAKQRRHAIVFGLLAATVLRIVCATIASLLLQILGLVLAGGVLLLWVCWKMWRELRTPEDRPRANETLPECPSGADSKMPARHTRKTLGRATFRIVLADVSMSLDNVLAIAGAAREHPFVLGFGLLLSILLMGVAADLMARLLRKHRSIAYLGLAIILYVACEMIYRGAYQLKSVIDAI